MKPKNLIYSGVALSAALSASGALAQTKVAQTLYSWQKPAAGVKANGPVDLTWQPQPFRFQAGKVVRYIDFEKGKNSNDGKTPATAWKHHPWDTAAPVNIRNQSGIDTFVFKRGVVYRGALGAANSGTTAAPIRLTSTPTWGTGEATISGAERVAGGWEVVNDLAAHGLPSVAAGKVWMTKLPTGTQPMLLWVVGADGAHRRLPIAREPNWRVSDPYRLGSEWWRWQKTSIDHPKLTGTDAQNLKATEPNAYVGATVWTDPPAAEFSWNPPEPSVVKAYDPATSTLTFMSNHPAKYPKQGSRYYLENLPRFLDEAGEWIYRAEGPNAGTLYLWAPDGQDPNAQAIEIARRWIILDIANQSNIALSSLTFRGGNAPDPSHFNSRREGANYDKGWLSEDMGAIRLHGNVSGVTVANCKVMDTAMGITSNPSKTGDIVDNVVIRDSEFANIDEGAIALGAGTVWRNAPIGRVIRADILRNRITEVGQRIIGGETRGISVDGGELLEIAGNIVHRTGGQGIDVHAGRSTGGLDSQVAKMGARPLTRVLMHHNKASETLLVIQDFGGIESWNSGPSYVFNNISINPVGWIRHNDWYHKNEAFYFDHQFKGYFFNNIGWTDPRPDAWDSTLSSSFFNQAQGAMTSVFHNTAYRFRSAFYKMTEVNNRDVFAANMAIAIPGAFFGHDKLKGNTTNAYSRNLLAGPSKKVFSFYNGAQFDTLTDFQTFLAEQRMLATDVGQRVDSAPVVNAEQHDFRPLPGSAAVGKGLKMFVPWGLYAVTGEWHFRKHQADPTRLIGENLFISSEHKGGADYNRFPMNNLRVEGAQLTDYEPGKLEDWVDGALKLDGKRVAVQEKLDKTYEVTNLDMDTNNFVVESYLRVDAKTSNGVIAGKLTDTSGYALRVLNGRINLLLRSGGREIQVTGVVINDGKWHHVLAEVVRGSSVVRIYLDGRLAVSGSIASLADTSLANNAEFTAGRGVVGAIDFLRVSRGSLADAKTTIGELYAWQFNGPHLKDFAGRAPAAGQRRAIGALEPATR